MGIFKFNESENLACIVCDHVANKERSIKLVIHGEADAQWTFLCGEIGHQTKNYTKISLTEVIDIDESVNDLFQMPKGYGATREDIKGEWMPFKQ